ncbi:FAD-dependent oxidoreductase [Rariglobus hedericola]|uniref:FAD-dependent oxidoreductase n=1 Tax=Rariglobus hedericola TaxID=2597822 RepID=A0A556QGL3_9BACT|nr:FAD-dependent oxidoreductase [Rariglobus hedericola]TSJ75776.1 FAD-dependent oxidoreductase [Rariglobus hedericola]
MKTYPVSARTVPLDDSWDVIVAGGGPAGCTAAIAAAREGARTLLIESTGSLGGAGTSALVPAWCPFSDKEKIIYRGLAETVFSAAKAGLAHVNAHDLDWVPINAERLKRVYDKLVSDAGVTVLFQTNLCSVEKSADDTVSALLISNKAGLTALKAKVYIDCTGDADLAAWAGAEFHQGDERGETQATTHCFTLGNVDSYAYRHSPDLGWWDARSPIHAILASGRYPEIPDKHLCNNLVGPGAVGFNAGHIWDVDNTDPASISRALIQGRKMADAYCRALAEFAPAAFANAFVVSTGAVLGVRETRRITGDYVLTLDDYLDRRSFPDEICRNSYFIDLHQTKEEHKDKLDEVEMATRFKHYGKGESHGIPYGCLTPRGLKNVLVAGRSISCERIVQGSVRVMPVCLAMGEAAGLAAALAVQTPGHDVHAVNTATLRDRLQQHGAYLPPVETPAETPMLATSTV